MDFPERATLLVVVVATFVDVALAIIVWFGVGVSRDSKTAAIVSRVKGRTASQL